MAFGVRAGRFFCSPVSRHPTLRPQLAHLTVVDGLLVLRPGLQASLTALEERVHPALDARLFQVVLPAGVDELHLTVDQLQQQLDLPLSRPPLKVLLHPISPGRGAYSLSSPGGG